MADPEPGLRTNRRRGYVQADTQSGWSPDLGAIPDETIYDDSDVLAPPGHSFTALQNRSVPSLPSQHQSPQQDMMPSLPSLPPYDPTSALDTFHALQLNDPVTRAGSAMSRSSDPTPRGDPIPRASSSMSHHSQSQMYSRPLNGLPSRPNANRTPSHPYSPQSQQEGSRPFDNISIRSGYSSGPHPSGHEDSNYTPALDHILGIDHATQYHTNDPNLAGDLYYAAQAPYGYPTQGYPNQYGPPVHPRLPQSGEYNPLYAAASDVLGVGPPPVASSTAAYPPAAQAHPAEYSQSSTSLISSQSAPVMGPPTQVLYSQDIAASQFIQPSNPTSSASTIRSLDEAEFEERPPLYRAGTAASATLRTQKTKAVDLRAPPYTKEYIDNYRQRIKADPDPEAHFAYGKYLIDAAKKIGADAKDQRAVRKFRDTLIQESLKVMRRLATQGQPYDEAQFFLANCYGTGMLGLQVDHEKAYHLYLQAAKQNHAAATYRVAVCNEIGAGTRKEPPRAAAFYRKAASLGDTAAMYKLGMILLQGSLGEAKNPREAIGWLRRAAEQADEENPHALHELALLHEIPNGQFIPHEPLQSKELYTRAAYLGYTQSQYKLGQCYEYGALGCPVDPRRSIAWYTKAAEKGNSEAELALSGWYLTGSDGVLVQSDSEAYLWARRAANKGLSKAEYAVGYYAEVGIGIKQDVEFAKRWYMRAAAQGNKRAMNRLTEMKRQGSKRANMARPTRQQAKDECVVC